MSTTIRQLIAGPPGTGKTRRLLGTIERELDGGVSPEQIAYCTFGRAATNDVRDYALERWSGYYEISDFAFRWFKTIHAIAYALLELRPERVVTDGAWQEFGRRHGYSFSRGASIEDGLTGATRTKDDELRAMYDWGRNRRLDQATALAHSPWRVSAHALSRFVVRYETFKKERRLVDFIDMLEEVLWRNLRPRGIQVAMVDEAQDLNRLQVEAIAAWFKHCDRLYVAGDDDQAIFTFQGADPNWLLEFKKHAHLVVLDQSWRVPRAVHEIADAIIHRNATRIDKPYRPRNADGVVDRATLDVAMRGLDPRCETLVLARNRCFVDDAAGELERHGVPYLIEGGASPLDPERGVARALRTGLALGRGETVRAADLAAMLKLTLSGAASAEAKATVGKLKPRDVLTGHDVRALLGGGSLLADIAARGAASALQKADQRALAYVDRVFAKYGVDVEPKIRLTTIHASKGREASTVVVMPDMTNATFEASRDVRNGGDEAENRVGYVAVTRARDRLVLVHARSQMAFSYPTGPRRTDSDVSNRAQAS
jgi:DNA helicase-2/ATP-dependent DNA helicase PcrA